MIAGRPATVLLVNHVGMVSGAETSLLVLLAALDRTRWHPVLVAPPGDLADRAAGLGVACQPLDFGRVRRTGPLRERLTGLLRLLRAAARLLALSADADVLHANSATACLACLPAALGRRRPLVWQVRDARWPPGLVKLLARGVDRAIAVSQAVADLLVDAGFPADRVTVVPNAADPALAPTRSRAAVRAELGLADDAEVLLLSGQLVPWKGHDVALAALARLASRPRVRLVVMGGDLFGEHAAYRAALARQAADLGVAERVLWTGYRRDVADVLTAADVLLLPSRGEPFGRVLLEAMAMGVPIVATAAGGAPEVLAGGRAGRLVPVDDDAALAAAVDDLLTNAGERRRLSAAGRRRVAAFRPEHHARQVEDVYRRVTSERRTTRIRRNGGEAL